MQGRKILVIEDKAKEAEAIADWLEPLGCKVRAAYSGASGLAAARMEHPDVIVLDIIMAEEDEGFQVLKALQGDPVTRSIPVVVFSITGDQMENRIRGLRLGAYYYLLKTKSLAELEATIRRALEITLQHWTKIPDPHQVPLYFDYDSGNIWIDGQKTEIRLSGLQRDLLALLFERRGLICSRDDIALRVYGTRDIDNETIDRLVGRLREKLNDNPQHPRFIESVRGVGYKLLVCESQE